MNAFDGRVTIENEEIVLRGYDAYLTKQEQHDIMMNVISNYPQHQTDEDFRNYLQGLTHAIENALKSRVLSKYENMISWHQFPHQDTTFVGNNPMALIRNRNFAVKGKHAPLNREWLSRKIGIARRQVFPVAGRKTRHRKNRRTSRKSRR